MSKSLLNLNVNSILRCRKYFKISFRRVFHCLLFSYQIRHNGSDAAEIVIFDTTELKRREDYKEYMDNFIEQCSVKRPTQVYLIKYSIDFLSSFRKMVFIIKNYKRKNPIKDLIQLSQLDALYHCISSINCNHKKVITFCDAHPEDNLIAQAVKTNENCITYTLQHGYYSYSPGTINQEVYANFISDYMLCWGESSVNNLISYGVAARKLKAFGYFKKNKICFNGGNEVFILLNGRHNSQTNTELLNLAYDIVNSTDLKVCIKKHPDDNSSYQNIDGIRFVNSIKEGVKNAQLAIISESGVFIEFHMASFPYFILKSDDLKKEFAELPNSYSSEEIIKIIVSGKIQKPFISKSIVTLEPDFESL
ncbi:hypothetical protein ACN5L3_000147 [Cronobacter malonaticus]|uniref:WepJ n=1 Tax=Cronobacter sakazakii TaxID=28141 RepID=I1W297_CROSK|nr:hypothetical protein [Cronobacter malonaticus]AFI60282.1 WepJ [Cronobacter sakazakii]ELY2620022.1 hypothetical protein [Cronobacter malonaticus]ELY3624762.1 hypothetical protein [Cronobacter malonaticus]ELY4819505.1 hypothetical protein [Cronobacter malonaticus]MDT3581321.1 hypothetical protein [Cronobacter malonaticus]